MKKRPLWYNTENTIGGLTMPREYRHIKEYEKEIIEMFNQGKTKREIAENDESAKFISNMILWALFP